MSSDDLEHHRLIQRFHQFVDADDPELRLYQRLCRTIPEDPAVMALLEAAQPGQRRPNLLLAALHDLVLQHPDEEYSRFYETVGGRYGNSESEIDPMPALRSFVAEHEVELAHLIATRSTQTNEVNRSCLWFVALRHATSDLSDRPISVIEIGASAGLNLRFDRYHYDFGSRGTYGNTNSDVHLRCDIRSGSPELDVELPPIRTRRGLELDPIDLSDAAERRWLKACIWPGQTDRHRRFDAAADLATADPPTLIRDDAVDGIADLIEACDPDDHVIVMHSWVLTYLRRDRRDALDRIIDFAGTDRDLTWISAEGEGVTSWVPTIDGVVEPHTVIGTSRWRSGDRTVERTGVCHPHLEWLRWEA